MIQESNIAYRLTSSDANQHSEAGEVGGVTCHLRVCTQFCSHIAVGPITVGMGGGGGGGGHPLLIVKVS